MEFRAWVIVTGNGTPIGIEKSSDRRPYPVKNPSSIYYWYNPVDAQHYVDELNSKKVWLEVYGEFRVKRCKLEILDL